MGKKYDKYVEAVQVSNMAKAELEAVNGGSTSQGMQNVRDVVFLAEIEVAEKWEAVMKDPEG